MRPIPWPSASPRHRKGCTVARRVKLYSLGLQFNRNECLEPTLDSSAKALSCAARRASKSTSFAASARLGMSRISKSPSPERANEMFQDSPTRTVENQYTARHHAIYSLVSPYRTLKSSDER